MPIEFACPCGRRLKIADQHAGKRVKCPACGEAQVVPSPEEEFDVDVVEEEEEVIPASKVRAKPPEEEEEEVIPARKVKAKPSEEEEEEEKPKKKSKKRRSRDKEGALSRMYTEQAREQMRRDEARARAAGGWGRDESGGWTMFGIHVTAGVVGGAGMLLFGLIGLAVIAIFRDEVVFGPRAIAGALIATALGGLTLVRSLFFGEED